MEYHTVIILNPKTGNRIVLDGVEAEVEIKHNYIQATKTGTGYKSIKSKTNSTHLDIILEMATPTSKQFEKIKKEIINDDLFLYFKDSHPNLIKCIFKKMKQDSQKTSINFTGNTTDKTYHEYVVETTSQLNAQIIHWNEAIKENKNNLTSPNDPIDDGIVEPNPIADPGFKKKVHFNKQKKRKDKVLKRKLTF